MYLITSLHTWGVLLASTAAAHLKVRKLCERTPEAEENKTKQMMHNKQRDALLQLGIVFLFRWIQKWLLLLLPWPQMLSVFLNCTACFNLLGAQDWWRLFLMDTFHIIRNVDITNHPTHRHKIMKFTSLTKKLFLTSFFLQKWKFVFPS